MNSEPSSINYQTDWIFAGLKIIANYSNNIVTAAAHDVIYSEYIDVLIDGNIDEDEVRMLRDLNWMVDEESECLHHYV